MMELFVLHVTVGSVLLGVSARLGVWHLPDPDVDGLKSSFLQAVLDFWYRPPVEERIELQLSI
jgi:hypothetical protein